MKMKKLFWTQVLVFCLVISTSVDAVAGRKSKSGKKEQPKVVASYGGSSSEEYRDLVQDPIAQALELCRQLPVALPNSESLQKEGEFDAVEQRRCELIQYLDQCTGSFGVKKFCKEFAKGVIGGVGMTAFTAWAGRACAPYILGEQLTENPYASAQAYTALTGAIGSTMSAAWKAWETCGITEVDALKSLDQKLRKLSREKMASLPSNFKELVKGVNRELDQKSSGARVEPSDLRKLIFKRELYFMMMPFETKDISQGSASLSDEEQSQMNADLEAIFKDYPGNESELRVLVNQIRAHSSRDLDSASVRRVQKYLYGPPGTGKTTLVSRLAKALGLYVCKLSARDFREIRELEGRGSAYSDVLQQDSQELIGKIGQCFREAQATNFILFIDELGDTFKSSSNLSQGEELQESFTKAQILENLKIYLDPEKKAIAFGFLGGLNIDFTRITVLGAGNYKLTDEALLRRLPELRFPRLSPSQKAVAFQRGYQEALMNLVKSSRGREEQLKTAKMIVDQYLEYIFELDKDFPGGGVVKEVLSEVFTYASSLVESGKTLESIDGGAFKSTIAGFFSSRKALQGDAE